MQSWSPLLFVPGFTGCLAVLSVRSHTALISVLSAFSPRRATVLHAVLISGISKGNQCIVLYAFTLEQVWHQKWISPFSLSFWFLKMPFVRFVSRGSWMMKCILLRKLGLLKSRNTFQHFPYQRLPLKSQNYIVNGNFHKLCSFTPFTAVRNCLHSC